MTWDLNPKKRIPKLALFTISISLPLIRLISSCSLKKTESLDSPTAIYFMWKLFNGDNATRTKIITTNTTCTACIARNATVLVLNYPQKWIIEAQLKLSLLPSTQPERLIFNKHFVLLCCLMPHAAVWESYSLPNVSHQKNQGGK